MCVCVCVCMCVCVCVCVCVLTKKGGGGYGSIATWHHNADPGFDEGHREVDDLWPLLVDGEWTHRHVGILQHHLRVDRRQTEKDRRETKKVSRRMMLNVRETWATISARY